ncbi:hypothetical protein C8R44DRAFT_727316 [Mycena epipterygia]|nr:hypothetical protein C8R44DRAFT_727316 [Mycena epipterygia]
MSDRIQETLSHLHVMEMSEAKTKDLEQALIQKSYEIKELQAHLSRADGALDKAGVASVRRLSEIEDATAKIKQLQEALANKELDIKSLQVRIAQAEDAIEGSEDFGAEGGRAEPTGTDLRDRLREALSALREIETSEAKMKALEQALHYNGVAQQEAEAGRATIEELTHKITRLEQERDQWEKKYEMWPFIIATRFNLIDTLNMPPRRNTASQRRNWMIPSFPRK